MTSARECLEEAKRLGDHYQLAINDFVDTFRRAEPEAKRAMIEAPLDSAGQLAALVAGTVSYLAREAAISLPPWVGEVTSPEPFFVLPAKSFAMRVRLMLESPPPFKVRRVYVPENYLERA